jgi:hypothetical protein
MNFALFPLLHSTTVEWYYAQNDFDYSISEKYSFQRIDQLVHLDIIELVLTNADFCKNIYIRIVFRYM